MWQYTKNEISHVIGSGQWIVETWMQILIEFMRKFLKKSRVNDPRIGYVSIIKCNLHSSNFRLQLHCRLDKHIKLKQNLTVYEGKIIQSMNIFSFFKVRIISSKDKLLFFNFSYLYIRPHIIIVLLTLFVFLYVT